ncbi:MAG: hypothetical protein RLZZ40_957 [Actinomycetota bacterium]|jgi:hypothetical protein
MATENNSVPPQPAAAVTPPAPAAEAPVAPRLNQVSLWALITGIASIVLWWIPAPFGVAAIALGHIGLVKTKGQGGTSRGFAIAGLILGYVWLALVIVIFGLLALWAMSGGLDTIENIDTGMMNP